MDDKFIENYERLLVAIEYSTHKEHENYIYGVYDTKNKNVPIFFTDSLKEIATFFNLQDSSLHSMRTKGILIRKRFVVEKFKQEIEMGEILGLM